MAQAITELVAPEMQMLINNKDSGYNYRYRRHADWDENYLLYRDKIIINRLTQRQSVNLPLMKSGLRTLLKDVDDMPVLYFENLDNDKQAELFKNEYWKETVIYNRMDLQDIVDKRQVFLFGRSFDQWQIINGWITQTIIDPMDILVSRYVDPFNIHSSRYLIHTHIFVPLSKLKKNKDYDQSEISEMEKWYASDMGLIKAAENQKMLTEKNQKMSEMGVSDVQSPILGETYVELTLHFLFRDDGKDKDGNDMPEQIFLYVEADNRRILMKKPLEEVIGVTKDHFWRNHYPYVSWADDLEKQDFWSDSVADIIRTPNKVVNAFFSQMIENRSLKNLNMNIYNSSLEGFQPQTWVPKAWGMYGIPLGSNGDIRQALQQLQVQDLTESLEEINFIVNMNDKAIGASATQQGVANQKQVTLGEVQLMVGEAKERIKGMSKFYTPAWEQRGLIFLKLIEAAPDKLDAVTIYRKGRNSNNIYPREITPDDWTTPLGYNVKVWSQEEKMAEDIDSINTLTAVASQFKGNQKLEEIKQRKLLAFAKLKPDEVNDVMQEEEEKKKAAAQGEANPTVPAESMQLPYDKVPPDIQRQMEKAFGFVPSQMGNMPHINADNPNAAPGMPGAQQQLPAGTNPQQPLQLPSQIQPTQPMPAKQ